LDTEYLTLNEAAEFIGVKRVTLYRWAKEHKVTIYKKSRFSYIKKVDAEKLKAEYEEMRPLEYPKK
jgi:excisionase family DNA binding protein